MTRHQEPAIVTHYRATIRAEPPKCCFTCDFYDKDGLCEKFDSVPPIEFASEPDGCDAWLEGVPF